MTNPTPRTPRPRRLALALVAVATTLLGGCAVMRDWLPTPPVNSAAPSVAVLPNGALVVRQEPLVFTREQTNVTITWSLEGSGLTFADNGIVIEGEVRTPAAKTADGGKPAQYTVTLDKQQQEIGNCRRVSPVRFTCVNRNSREGTYLYTIRALRDGKPLPPLDPSIINMR
jgi:hypothetical protein